MIFIIGLEKYYFRVLLFGLFYNYNVDCYFLQKSLNGYNLTNKFKAKTR